MPYVRRSGFVCLLLAALLLMSACTGPSTTVPTTVAPTTAPATAPTAAGSPTAAPAPATSPAATAMPALADAVLPAPLYVLDTGQIVRIERDGVTRRQITNEAPPAPDALAIVQFDASPVDGTLVYIVQGLAHCQCWCAPMPTAAIARFCSIPCPLLRPFFRPMAQRSRCGSSKIMSVQERTRLVST